MSDLLATADVNARAIQREAEKARNAARNLAQAKSEKGVQQHLARVEERLSNIAALAQSEVLTRGRMERGYGRGERRAQQQRVLEEKVQRLTAELEQVQDQARARHQTQADQGCGRRLEELEQHDGRDLDGFRLPDVLVGQQDEIDHELEEQWARRTDELLAAEPAVGQHSADNGAGRFAFSPGSCVVCRRIAEMEMQAATDVGALPERRGTGVTDG